MVLKLFKPLYMKGDKSEFGNYGGVSVVSVGSKLLSMMILFRLRDPVDGVLRQCGFRKGRGCASQIFTLGLIIKKSLSHQIPLVLSFIDYKQVSNSANRRALSLCIIVS